MVPMVNIKPAQHHIVILMLEYANISTELMKVQTYKTSSVALQFVSMSAYVLI